jgi:hypothetical protein
MGKKRFNGAAEFARLAQQESDLDLDVTPPDPGGIEDEIPASWYVATLLLGVLMRLALVVRCTDNIEQEADTDIGVLQRVSALKNLLTAMYMLSRGKTIDEVLECAFMRDNEPGYAFTCAKSLYDEINATDDPDDAPKDIPEISGFFERISKKNSEPEDRSSSDAMDCGFSIGHDEGTNGGCLPHVPAGVSPAEVVSDCFAMFSPCDCLSEWFDDQEYPYDTGGKAGVLDTPALERVITASLCVSSMMVSPRSCSLCGTGVNQVADKNYHVVAQPFGYGFDPGIERTVIAKELLDSAPYSKEWAVGQIESRFRCHCDGSSRIFCNPAVCGWRSVPVK